MSDTTKPTVTLLGREHVVCLPDFAAREELMVAYGDAVNRKGTALLRVYGAALGLCTRLGKEAGTDYALSRFDVLAYGGAVYGHLRTQGITPAQVAQAGMPVVVLLSESLFPRESEVTASLGNSAGDEGN